MRKLIEIPDKTLDKLKKKALSNKCRSVKKYMEDVLIHHANQVKETHVHFMGETLVFKHKDK